MEGDKFYRISENLVRLIRTVMVIHRRKSGDKPLTHDPTYWVLGLLLYEELPISEIGRRLSRSKPNMTALIDKLMEEGMVSRIPDKQDRRVINIAITEKGRLLMKVKKREVMENVKASLVHLDKQEVDRLYSALEEVNSILIKESD